MGGGPARDQPSVEVPEEFKVGSGVGLADKILKAKEIERAKEKVKKVKGKRWECSMILQVDGELMSGKGR